MVCLQQIQLCCGLDLIVAETEAVVAMAAILGRGSCLQVHPSCAFPASSELGDTEIFLF